MVVEEPGESTQPIPAARPEGGESAETKERSRAEREQTAQRMFEEGSRLFESGKFHDAINAFEEAVRLDESKATYFCLLGQAMGKNPHWIDSAVEHLERARSIDQEDLEILWQLAQLYDRSETRREEAFGLYREVLARDPSHFGARSRLASASGKFVGEGSAVDPVLR